MRQPPAYSPLSWTALRASARGVLRRDTAARSALRALLARTYGADAVGLYASGTQALQVALTQAAAQLGADGSVALPAFTCFDVATAAVGAGLRITLYDLDPATLAPDLESLSGALAAGARIVVVTPLFGFPVDWQAVVAIAAAHGAIVIEDAAQGSGATWHGARLGSLGDRSVLSFGRGKGWTGGQGGALLARHGVASPALLNGRDLGEDLQVLARATAQWAFGRPSLYGVPAAVPWLGLGETHYRDPVPPAALPQAAARLLLHDLAASQREAEARRARAEQLLERIATGPRIQPIRPLPGGQPGYLRLPMRVAGGLLALRDPERAEQLGVVRSYPAPLSALPAVQARLVSPARRERAWPGAAELVRTLITLPTHSLLTPRDLEQLTGAIGS